MFTSKMSTGMYFINILYRIYAKIETIKDFFFLNYNNNTALNSTYKAETALYSLYQITQNYETNCNLSHVKRGLPTFLLKI